MGSPASSRERETNLTNTVMGHQLASPSLQLESWHSKVWQRHHWYPWVHPQVRRKREKTNPNTIGEPFRNRVDEYGGDQKI